MHARWRHRLISASRTLINLYSNSLSHIMLHSCRFMPTCSRYAIEALERHGFFRGGWQASRRLLRCHPLCRGGFDPVR